MFTDRLYTGQRQIAALGIYHYNARFYSPQLGRFLSADSAIPDLFNPQYLNRYSYVLNNPIRYIDLSGHDVGCPGLDLSQCYPSSTTSPETNDGGGSNDAGTSDTPTSTPTPATTPVPIKIIPDGWKSSIMVSAGWGSNLYANGKKVPTVLYWGLSLVRDSYGGIQLFYETLDIEFDPTLQLNPGEQAQPSELFGIGISVTKGLIWKTDRTVFVTNNYEGETHSSGGNWGIVTADYYESFPNPNIKGLDIGVSGGTPSLWSISTKAYPLFDMPRIDLSFWQDP